MLLDDNYTARLTDFGYASIIGVIPGAFDYLKEFTNRPGALRYAAPEHFQSELQEIRRTASDIYSFGCIALQASSLLYIALVTVLIQS